MATVRKNLGGGKISVAATDVDIYTVPAATDTIVSTVVICNQAATATTFQLRHRIAGAAAATSQLLAKDVAIAANSTITLSLGITMAATDVLTFQAPTVTVSANAYGQENT